MNGEGELKREAMKELSVLIEDIDLVPCCNELRGRNELAGEGVGSASDSR